MEETQNNNQEELDSWSLYLYAMKSPVTREKYQKRLEKFFDSLGLEGITIEEKSKKFVYLAKEKGNDWVFNAILKFMQFQLDRANRKEITGSTVRNYLKSIKLFCEMADFQITWKKISRGLPRAKNYSNDRIPTMEEIRKLLEYPDRRLKSIIYTMASAGIRLGAWVYKKYNLNCDNSNNQRIPIEKLFEKDFVILEGHNRHEALMRMMESLIQRNNSIMSLGQIKKISYDLNQQHCQPPLDEWEFEKQWTSAVSFIQKVETKDNNDEDNGTIKLNDKKTESSKADDEQGNTIEKIVSLIENRCIETFSDQFNEIYVLVRINGHFEALSIDSNRFEKLVIMECFTNKIAINKDRIKNIIDIIKTKIEFSNDANKRILNLRIAKSDSSFYYDLANSKWETVKISQDGWNVIPNNQAIFKRYKNNMEQVYPNKNHSPGCIDRFLNLINLHSKKDKLLLLVYLVSLFVPDIAKPILLVYGSKGAAKTTTFELIKNVIDPSIADTLSFPKETNDLIQIISHNYVAYFDNISTVSHSLSDLLCRAVTGTVTSKRKNYTDDEVFIYRFKRAIGINGINIASVKPDFLDRYLILEVNRIPKEMRRKEEDVKTEFKQLLPDILGWIFDVLVKVLKYKNENPEKTKLKQYPRMADFAEYGEIIARCIGYEEQAFIETYFENMEIQDNEVIESSVVANVLMDFMEDKDKWEGSATLLHATLTDYMENTVGQIRKKHNNLWPSDPNALSRKINELAPTLKEKGIDIIHNYDNKRKGRQIKIINLKKISSISSYRSSLYNVEEIRSEQGTSNFFPSGNADVENKIESLDTVIEINSATSNDTSKQHKITAVQYNIHEIANRSYPHSDIWICKNCNRRGDRFDIINHVPYCKNNKKQ